MVDLTKNKKERNNYIIDIDENPYVYLVKYASGKRKSFPKTEAIRAELLEKLEKQFWSFSKEYKIYTKNSKRINTIENIFLFGVVELVLFIIHYNVPSNILNDLFTNFITSFSSIFYLLWTIWENGVITEKLNKVHIIEVFLKHKEDFEVLLYKFNNGDEIKYSPVDLMNIDNFNSLEEICDFVDEAEKEIKLEKIY